MYEPVLSIHINMVISQRNLRDFLFVLIDFGYLTFSFIIYIKNDML